MMNIYKREIHTEICMESPFNIFLSCKVVRCVYKSIDKLHGNKQCYVFEENEALSKRLMRNQGQ